jgi:hypothetical protein
MLELTLKSGDETMVQEQRGVVIDYPSEFRLRSTDEAKLQAIASLSGGRYDPKPEDIFAPDGRTVDLLFPLWPYLLAAALVVYLADVAVRRLNVDKRESNNAFRRKAA